MMGAREAIPLYTLSPAMAVLRNDSSPIGNDTIDVMIKGCFSNYDTIACIRNGVMSMLDLLTVTMCIIKLCQLHINRHPTFHQYIIFYTAIIEGILLSVHWLVGLYAQLDFIAGYLKLGQFLVVSHFYWTLANRALRKETRTNRVIVPVYSIAFVYFTVIAVLGCINVQVSWIECLQPYWLALSATEFALVQLFMVAGIYITRRLNEISTLDCVRRSQKRDLWSIILAFEISSLVAVLYDIILLTLGDEVKGCSGVFLHMQEIYSPVFGSFMVVKFLLPLWAMLFVFHPMEGPPRNADLLPVISEDGSFTSVFAPTDQSNRYRQLRNPTRSADNILANPSQTLPTAMNNGIRRSSSNRSNLSTICEDADDHDRLVNDDNSDKRPILQ